MKKIFFEKTLLFIVSFGFIAMLFLSYSYYFFLNNYKTLENNANIKCISSLIKTFDNELIDLGKEKIDYTIFNDMYDFSNKLSDLNVHFVAISNMKNKILFDNYKKDFKISNKELFRKTYLQKTDKQNFNSTIFEFENKIIYISKIPISKSKKVKKTNEYFYLAKEITNENINEFVKFFKSVKYIKDSSLIKEKSKKFTSKYFSNVYLTTSIENNLLINRLQFLDKNNNYLFTIKTTNIRDIVNTGKSTIMNFSIIVFLFVLVLLFITYKYIESLKVNNEILEERVTQRTRQIKAALVEVEKINFKLFELAHTDFLTKTRNRRDFFLHSEDIFKKSLKQNNNLCIVMIDIDNFKTFNDEYGHDMGDKVLILFAECIKKYIDEKYIFARLGGEEFAITFPNTEIEFASKQAELLRKKVQEIEIITSTKTLKITASFGVSDIEDCENIDQVLAKADKMLYSAKNSGKNIVRSRLNITTPLL